MAIGHYTRSYLRAVDDLVDAGELVLAEGTPLSSRVDQTLRLLEMLVNHTRGAARLAWEYGLEHKPGRAVQADARLDQYRDALVDGRLGQSILSEP